MIYCELIEDWSLSNILWAKNFIGILRDIANLIMNVNHLRNVNLWSVEHLKTMWAYYTIKHYNDLRALMKMYS